MSDFSLYVIVAGIQVLLMAGLYGTYEALPHLRKPWIYAGFNLICAALFEVVLYFLMR